MVSKLNNLAIVVRTSTTSQTHLSWRLAEVQHQCDCSTS
jgi:hypothetical protein